MMQSAKNGPRLDSPKSLNSTLNGRMLARRQVRAGRVVIIQIGQQHVAPVPLAAHDDMVIVNGAHAHIISSEWLGQVEAQRLPTLQFQSEHRCRRDPGLNRSPLLSYAADHDVRLKSAGFAGVLFAALAAPANFRDRPPPCAGTLPMPPLSRLPRRHLLSADANSAYQPHALSC
jgi:hypothetical protein